MKSAKAGITVARELLGSVVARRLPDGEQHEDVVGGVQGDAQQDDRRQRRQHVFGGEFLLRIEGVVEGADDGLLDLRAAEAIGGLSQAGQFKGSRTGIRSLHSLPPVSSSPPIFKRSPFTR